MKKDWNASEMGKKGGAAGTGKSKTRSPEHYRKMAKLAQERRDKAKAFRVSLGIET